MPDIWKLDIFFTLFTSLYNHKIKKVSQAWQFSATGFENEIFMLDISKLLAFH